MNYYKMEDHAVESIRERIRNVPDFPSKGVMFRDITPLLADAQRFDFAVDLMTPRNCGEIEVVAAIESRGFVFAAPMARALKVPLVLVRKSGKLPQPCYSKRYDLEYGSQILELQYDAVQPGQKVLLVDDLLATGGTTAAAVNLIEQAGGKVLGVSTLIELKYCHGRKALKGISCHSIVSY